MPKHTQRDRDTHPRKPYTKPRQPAASPSSSSSRPPPPAHPHPRRGPHPRPNAEPKSKTKTKAQPTQLDLSGQHLATPPSPAQLAPVAKLNLTNCSLESISFAKHAATSLTWLNVTGNALADPAAWAGIDQLQTLFVLNASHCGLTEVPTCVASLSKLKALVLSHNSLTTLRHVANLPDLNTVVVSNNALTALPSSLATLPALKKISAAHNRLTSSSLPDLSALAHLHEVRLNDNPTLTSLPPHFGTWGKADGAKGLEILDLGNCGFESWFGLRELAKQAAVVNLGLKGNKVAEDAVRDTGFDQFKAKLTILLPSLRILDTHRFDAKFADLKSRRLQRTDEQRILDAGPMALAANAQSDAPVPVDDVVKARERERENRRRRRKGILEEVGEGRAKKRVKTTEDGVAAAAAPAEGASVEPDANEGGAARGADEAVQAVAEERKKPKKRKSRAEKRAAKEGAAQTASSEAVDAAPAPAAAVATAADEEAPPAGPADPAARAPTKSKKDKTQPRKKKGGVLAALQGDDDDDDDSSAVAAPARGKPAPAAASSAPAPASAPAAAPAPPPQDDKQKTSVAKIIEVRRPGDGKGGAKKRKGAAADDSTAAGGAGAAPTQKVDVGALLGLTKPVEVGVRDKEDEEAGKTPAGLLAGLGGAAGTGLFGGGGWD